MVRRARYSSHMSHRQDEPEGRHFRSDRLVVVNGSWFIATREGIDVGPFPSRDAAALGSVKLAESLVGIDDPEIVRFFIREFQRRDVE